MGRALLVLETPADRQKAVHWIGKAPLGTRVEFKASKRTLPQNDLMWALLTEFAERYSHNNNKYEPSQWKSIFLHAFGREVAFLPSLDGKTFLPIEMSSSDLSKEEMTDFIEFILKEAAERGVILTNHQPETSDESPPSSGAGVDAVPPHHGVDSDIPAQADQLGGELDPSSASSSSGSTLSDEDKRNLGDFIVRLCAAVGPDVEVITMARNSFAAEKRPLSQLAKDKAQAITGYFRSVCGGEMEAADAIELACGIAQIDQTELGIG